MLHWERVGGRRAYRSRQVHERHDSASSMWYWYRNDSVTTHVVDPWRKEAKLKVGLRRWVINADKRKMRTWVEEVSGVEDVKQNKSGKKKVHLMIKRVPRTYEHASMWNLWWLFIFIITQHKCNSGSHLRSIFVTSLSAFKHTTVQKFRVSMAFCERNYYYYHYFFSRDAFVDQTWLQTFIRFLFIEESWKKVWVSTKIIKQQLFSTFIRDFWFWRMWHWRLSHNFILK